MARNELIKLNSSNYNSLDGVDKILYIIQFNEKNETIFGKRGEVGMLYTLQDEFMKEHDLCCKIGFHNFNTQHDFATAFQPHTLDLWGDNKSVDEIVENIFIKIYENPQEVINN